MMVSKGVEDIDIKVPKDAYDTGRDIPTFNAYLIAVVRDDKGRIIKIHRQRSHSPTNYFIVALLPEQWYLETGTSASWTSTSGATNTIIGIPNGSHALISYPNTHTNYQTYLVGIMVGSGQQSNPASAHNLAAPIANGTGAGQLVYQAPTLPSQITINGNSAYFYIGQTYINRSGGTVTITEAGIVVEVYLTEYTGSSSTAYNQGNILMWYDILSPSMPIPNGGTVTIYYTFTVNP
jgi:hypothetical protein